MGESRVTNYSLYEFFSSGGVGQAGGGVQGDQL